MLMMVYSFQQADAKLVMVIERVFLRCTSAKQYRQTVGLALETRRMDILEKAITESGDLNGMLDYVRCMQRGAILFRKIPLCLLQQHATVI